MGNLVIDPDDTNLDFKADWAVWLQDGDTISTSTWVVPAGLSKVTDDKYSTYNVIWLDGSGATVGTVYEVVNRIVTVLGRTEDQTLLIECAEN